MQSDRFSSSSLVIEKHSDLEKSSRCSKVLWMLAPVIVFFVVMLIGSIAMRSAFGTFPLAMRYLRGERLVIEPDEIHVERPKESGTMTVEAVLRNISSRPVNVIGANVSCSCMVTGNLPVKIEPGAAYRLPIIVNFMPDKIVDEAVVLFTDLTNHARLGVRVKVALPMAPE